MTATKVITAIETFDWDVTPNEAKQILADQIVDAGGRPDLDTFEYGLLSENLYGGHVRQVEIRKAEASMRSYAE